MRRPTIFLRRAPFIWDPLKALEVFNLKLRQSHPHQDRWWVKPNYGRSLFTAFLSTTLVSIFSTPAFAANGDVWDKATEIMKDVYNQILGISTIAAIVTAATALLLMNFSRNGKTVDESRAWLKRIIITWAILNGLGFIMAYISPFFTGGQYTP